jgi:hypothetical protein
MMPMFLNRRFAKEARQFTEKDALIIEHWCNGSCKGLALPRNAWTLEVRSFGGTVFAKINDWIVKGENDLHYVYTPEQFEAAYEPVKE